MSSLWELFYTFAKIGLFTFGGGYAMIPMIDSTCVENKKWITQEEMMNITVVAESTPGPVAINCATFVGYKQRGLAGAVCATLGMILPSFVIIFLIALFLDNFLEIKIIADAFRGIKLAVGILILGAALKMFSKMKKDPYSVAVMAVSACAMLAVNIFSVSFASLGLILIAAVLSLVLFAVREHRKGGR